MMRIVGGGLVKIPCKLSLISMRLIDCYLKIIMCETSLTDFSGMFLLRWRRNAFVYLILSGDLVHQTFDGKFRNIFHGNWRKIQEHILWKFRHVRFDLFGLSMDLNPQPQYGTSATHTHTRERAPARTACT